eukprot:352476-Chlamydomonas_euryale.AAC.21
MFRISTLFFLPSLRGVTNAHWSACGSMLAEIPGRMECLWRESESTLGSPTPEAEWTKGGIHLHMGHRSTQASNSSLPPSSAVAAAATGHHEQRGID